MKAVYSRVLDLNVKPIVKNYERSAWRLKQINQRLDNIDVERTNLTIEALRLRTDLGIKS